MPQPKMVTTYTDILGAMGYPSRHWRGGDMTMVPLGKMKLSHVWKVAIAFLFAILVGFALHFRYPCTWPLYRPMMALADSLMVAGVIGLALESFATRYLIEKTATHLAEKLTGMGLSPNIKSRIWAIANTKLARSNYQKQYTLTDLGNGKLKVETITTFDIENYGDKTENYTPEADEEVVFDPKFPYLHYSLKGTQYSFTEDTLIFTDKHGRGTTRQAAGKEIEILPRTIDPSAVCKVKWVIEATMQETWFDLTEFRYPTENATIYLAGKPAQLEFYCTGKTTDSKTWTFDEPFMVGQQLKVWWTRKPSTE